LKFQVKYFLENKSGKSGNVSNIREYGSLAPIILQPNK
jgi:hypothetical protein